MATKIQPQLMTWQQFTETIRPMGSLLRRLDDFPNSVLVTGCQRSGTTMLARIITQSNGFYNYWFGQDDELDAALILSGNVDHKPQGRYCFQTTYVNEYYHEYYDHQNGHKIVWVLRNPFSVVRSMLYNWGHHTPDTLFRACGVPVLSGKDKWLYKLFGLRGLPMLRRACWAYSGKTSQVFELHKNLGPDRIMVIDYDHLVARQEVVLPAIYQFIGSTYKSDYADRIHTKSLRKKDLLSEQEYVTVKSMCEPVYQGARALLANV